jgi:hypothetical protein
VERRSSGDNQRFYWPAAKQRSLATALATVRSAFTQEREMERDNERLAQAKKDVETMKNQIKAILDEKNDASSAYLFSLSVRLHSLVTRL